jgi:hypothetical protein
MRSRSAVVARVVGLLAVVAGTLGGVPAGAAQGTTSGAAIIAPVLLVGPHDPLGGQMIHDPPTG